MLLNHENVEDEGALETNKVMSDSMNQRSVNETANSETLDSIIPKTRDNFIELTKYIKIYFEPNAKKY